MLSYAKKNGIPVWTASKLLSFLKTREEAQFSDILWRRNRLSFKFNSTLEHENGVSIMIPYRYNQRTIKGMTLNKGDAAYTIRSVKGTPYAFLSVKPGADHVISVIYSDL